MNITILGGGSWGSALAIHLAKKGHSVKIWEFFAEQAQKMQEERYCPFLKETKFPNNIFVTSEMKESLINAELVLVVVPSDHVEKTMERAQEFLNSQPILICSKGFSANLDLLSKVVKENVQGKVYCLYGPTHAEEVSKGMFSGIVLAGREGKENLKKELETERLKVELSDDLIGVQVAAALKNALAIFVGILYGSGQGDNAKAYIMTKGLEEIKQFGMKLGAEEETFLGLAGLGDIIVTCTSEHSRNFRTGKEVGKGRKLDEVLQKMEMVAEGVSVVKNIPKLKEKYGVKMPLFMGLYQILVEGKSAEEVLRRL